MKGNIRFANGIPKIKNKTNENTKCKKPCKYVFDLITDDSPNIIAALQLAAGVAKAAFVAIINPINITSGFPPICKYIGQSIGIKITINTRLCTTCVSKPITMIQIAKKIVGFKDVKIGVTTAIIEAIIPQSAEFNALAIGSVAIINHITFHCIPFAAPCNDMKCSPLALQYPAIILIMTSRQPLKPNLVKICVNTHVCGNNCCNNIIEINTIRHPKPNFCLFVIRTSLSAISDKLILATAEKSNLKIYFTIRGHKIT